MKLEQLKQFAKEGKLKLHKYDVCKFNRTKYIYFKTENPDDPNFYKIKEVIKIPYTRYYYSCRTDDMPEHQRYKITAKDYKELEKLSTVSH